MDTEEYRKEIENKILVLMQNGLLTGNIQAARAKETARYVLDTLKPHMSLEEIYKKAEQFDQHFSELIPIALP